MTTVSTEQAYVKAKNKLNEIIAMVTSVECDAQQMWETVLMIKAFPYGVYELLFNCCDNTYARIYGILHSRRPRTAEYHYRIRSNSTQWILYPLNIFEQQAILDFAVTLQNYIQPTIVKPEIVSSKII